MTFEKEFPSLKGKELSKENFVGIITYPMGTFGYRNGAIKLYPEGFILEACLDKQKVIDTIEKHCSYKLANSIKQELKL